MSLAASVTPHQLSRLADEVAPLLERLRASALEAGRAIDGGNLLELVRSLQERERVFVRVGPLIDEIRIRSGVAIENAGIGGRPAVEIEDTVARVLAALRGVQASDTALRERVDGLRSFAASELTQVRRQRAEQAGYAGAKQTGTNVDLRR